MLGQNVSGVHKPLRSFHLVINLIFSKLTFGELEFFKSGYDHIKTKNLNEDILDNYFGTWNLELGTFVLMGLQISTPHQIHSLG